MPQEVRFSRLECPVEDRHLIIIEFIESETHECSTNTNEHEEETQSNTEKKQREDLIISIITGVLFASYMCMLLYIVSLTHGAFDGNSSSPYRMIPLEAVDEVIVYLSKAENMTCSDHDSCDNLRRRIEQRGGMKYNFVIGSGMELFVGSGFQFYSEASNGTSALYIKVFMNGIQDDGASKRCWCMNNVTSVPNDNPISVRISEIVQQGTVCGKIKENSTISVICGDTFEKCFNESVSNYHSLYDQVYTPGPEINGTSVAGEDDKTRYDHYDPDPESGTILMNDFRLLTCERPKHGRRTMKGTVITLKSLVPATCEPFRPVERVRVDLEHAPPNYCDDEQPGMPCANLSSLMVERDHDAAYYNFVLGTQHDLYVGLGYSCRALPALDGTTETLRIKVLRAAESDGYHLKLLYGLINQGRRCGWIASNYSLVVDCDCGLNDYVYFSTSLPFMKQTDFQFLELNHTVGETHREKVNQNIYQWILCNHEQTNVFPDTVHFLQGGTINFTQLLDEFESST